MPFWWDMYLENKMGGCVRQGFVQQLAVGDEENINHHIKRNCCLAKVLTNCDSICNKIINVKVIFFSLHPHLTEDI
jgi:hypothetical protein